MDDDGKDSLFHWKFLPFGLKNAPAEFQRVMDQVLKGLPFARCYIDDVIIFNDSPSEHVRHLQQVFERLRAWGLRLHHGITLTRTGQGWKWGPAQDEAFEALKKALGLAFVLRCLDTRRPFQLHTDWSLRGLGAVLTLKDDDGKEYVIAYASRSNNDAEAKYSSYEGECLAVVWTMAHFRPYMYSQSFTVVTDHQPLKWLMESHKLTGKLARWALLLHVYDFEVIHKARVKNLDADGLSRNPSPLQEDLTGARWHGTSDQEAVPGRHASAYLTWMEGDLVRP